MITENEVRKMLDDNLDLISKSNAFKVNPTVRLDQAVK